ncbi:hypothetical protein B0H13DRAFT_2266251 [Mycena leptocephala]|nr:hypothetical protein B0H13DRAFT_2266251 [Mycena leptocephala]
MMSTSQLPSQRVAPEPSMVTSKCSAYLASSTSNLLIYVLSQSPLPRPNIVTQQDYKISQSVVEVSSIKSISILEYTVRPPAGSRIARTAISGVVLSKTDRVQSFEDFSCVVSGLIDSGSASLEVRGSWGSIDRYFLRVAYWLAGKTKRPRSRISLVKMAEIQPLFEALKIKSGFVAQSVMLKNSLVANFHVLQLLHLLVAGLAESIRYSNWVDNGLQNDRSFTWPGNVSGRLRFLVHVLREGRGWSEIQLYRLKTRS